MRERENKNEEGEGEHRSELLESEGEHSNEFGGVENTKVGSLEGERRKFFFNLEREELIKINLWRGRESKK